MQRRRFTRIYNVTPNQVDAESAKQTFTQSVSATYMVFSMDTDSISPEENNLLRLIYVIKKPCTECLRHVLKTYIPSGYSDIKHAVSSERIKLQGILTKKQYSRIFPHNQLCPNFDVSICDMTLLYTLLRNVSSINPPTTGWDKPVNNQPRDSSLGANVERLRVLRNDIIHEERHEITDPEFNNFWSDIKASLADIDQSLGNTTFQQDVIYLRTLNLDTRFVQKEITKIRTRQNLQEIKEQQKNHTTILEELKNRYGEKHTAILEDLNNRMIKIQHQVCRNTAVHCEERNENVIDPQDVAGCKGIQRLSLEDLESADGSNQQCMNDRKSEEANYTDSVNIQNQHHNEADDKGASNNALNCDMSRENDISIAEGPDSFICLTKQFVYIKSNLLKKDVDKIAEWLFKEELITKDEHEAIANLKRRKPCVDTLLKKIILGDTDQMKTFVRALKSVNLKVFRELQATKVTDEDRSRFKQVKERALQVTNAMSRSDSEAILDDSDILFFQNCLSASKEVVDSINDAMLAHFNFSVRDHSNVLECKNSDPKIQKLCETMNLCNMDVENELKSLLRVSLYEEWMEFRKRKGNHDRKWYLRWLNAPVTLVRFMFPTLHFKKAVNGCIILKFMTGAGFDIASLTREFVQENVTDLLWKGYLETQINISNPVHITVFIMSTSKNGNDEIHFYLDFDAKDDSMRGEDYEQKIADQERRFLLEELDLVELTEWMINQPDMEETTKQMLEDKLSSSDMSRKEELNILLDSIYEIKNRRELIERFYKENDPDVYSSLFSTIDQDSSEKHKSLVQKPLQYETGGGLQRLYSFWMDINTDQKDIKMSQETEDLPRVILDERPSKELPDPEDAYSGVPSGYTYNPVYDFVHKIRKKDKNLLEPAVWKMDASTVVIQVGKLEEIWSDAMVIFGNGRSSHHLPRTIIEKVGPQIQREFQDKYPNGLSENEVAVLSGFNLPVWKIFYCECSEDEIYRCFIMASKLKMRSILFLVQEECFTVRFGDCFKGMFDFFLIHKPFSSISTSYIHVDQGTLEWKKLRKIVEEELFTKKGLPDFYTTDVTMLSANPKPKVFNIGHPTVIIQFGKMEEIQSDAMVIFEVAKGQWPIQNLPSEILEKAGPLIQREFKEKFPVGIEYAEVAVLNGYNLPVRTIMYGVLPRWPVAWIKQVIEVFVTECFQLASDQGIKSIAFMIPSITYHVAKMYASVLHSCVEMRIVDKPSPSILAQSIVIKDGCTGANMLKKVFIEEWARRIVFKEGHVTVVIQERLLDEILIRRGKETQTCAILSEEPQEKATIADSKALVILSKLEDVIDILVEISPSLKEEFRTKYPSGLLNEEVAILDGYNNPFKKIYCSKYSWEVELQMSDIILECLQMAENDKMNSITLLIRPEWRSRSHSVTLSVIHRVFVIENPSSCIRRLYVDSQIFRQESSDVSSVKVFKERHVTVVLNTTYNIFEYIYKLHCTDGGIPANKMKSVHVICGVTDVGQPRGELHDYLENKMPRYSRHNLFLSQSLQRKKEGMMQFPKGFTSSEIFILEHNYSNIGVFFGTPKLDRQDMDMFFYKCIQKADGSGVPSITFLVPNIGRSIKLFASTLISCVKRFAKNSPFSSIKRIYIRFDEYNPQFLETKRIVEEEWAKTSGEENPKLQIDESQEKQEGKQGYPSEDIFLKKTMTYSKLAEKSKEGSKYLPQEDVIFEEEWAKTSGEENPKLQIDESQEIQEGKQGYPSEDIFLKKTMTYSKLAEKSKEGSKYLPQEDVN